MLPVIINRKVSYGSYRKGIGVYSSAFVDLGNFRVKMGHWICNDFITMFGIPYFGTVSTKKEGITYDKPQTLFCSIEYSRMFGKHYALGLEYRCISVFPGDNAECQWRINFSR